MFDVQAYLFFSGPVSPLLRHYSKVKLCMRKVQARRAIICGELRINERDYIIVI